MYYRSEEGDNEALLTLHSPALRHEMLLLLVEQAENPLFHIERELRRQFPAVAIEPVVCNITDQARVAQMFERAITTLTGEDLPTSCRRRSGASVTAAKLSDSGTNGRSCPNGHQIGAKPVVEA